jgi:glutamyl-tRNA(Gln) amidotransferase subunit E
MSAEPKSADTGLKVGLEIHQQLSTGKLFCRCPSDLEEQVAGTFVRRLRATKSELGEIDQAALAETQKKLLFHYEMTPSTSCLVDADEEPPHPMNEAALDVALTMAALSSMEAVDEVHVMRKIVVDGSNTTGFQRTALVAGGGALPMPDGSKLALQSLCIEEDSAREMDETDGNVVYRLDRLGIPLVEIATAPDIKTPQEAKEVAARIGALLRATGRVKRGQGTIRQDLNVSVDGGARVELKGVQELRVLPQVIEEEARRQRRLNKAAEALKAAGVEAARLRLDPHDLTALFASTTSKLVRKALDAGGAVWGIRLEGFAGTLGSKMTGDPDVRVLGPELSQRARVMGLGGTIHSEEGDLTAKYGMSADEVKAAGERLQVTPRDAFLLAAGPKDRLERAFKSIAERARLATRGTVSEVRAVNIADTERYTSQFLRPMPGAARMYPETDIPPIVLTHQRLDRVRKSLPPLPENRMAALIRRTGIAPALAEQLAQTDNLERFEEIALDETNDSAPDAGQAIAVNSAMARLLLTEVAADDREDKLDWAKARAATVEIRNALRAGQIAKEAVPRAYAAMVREGLPAAAALKASAGSSLEDARRTIRTLVEGKEALVREKGEAAQGPLMGMAMKELRGRVDGKIVADLLRAEISRLLAMGPG